MIKYKSTRGNAKLYSFSEVLLKGIADDGGLFIPEKLPKLIPKQLYSLLKKSYQERADFILNLFETDFSKKTIGEIVDRAYSANFDTHYISPIIHLKNNQYILELWHGPTSTFKDMALQITPLLFSKALENDNQKRAKNGEKLLRYLILTATSGDTGKAALEGFKNKDNIYITIFYPEGHVSKFQKLQMVTQEGLNVSVYALKGDFDAVQRAVKAVFNDKQFNEALKKENQTILSSANSINWGRLLPQIIYHVSSYLDLIYKGVISNGEQVDIAVPTGNFGNILAAFYAKKMGLPIRRLICASNENNVLTKFLKTGVYDIRNRKLVQTCSPAMDILIASNIERLLYIITENPQKVSEWMNDLKVKEIFEADDKTKAILQKEFFAGYVSNEDCLENIKKIYDQTKYLMDPHTSVAQLVAERYIKEQKSSLPIIICSTAHWAKFAGFVYKALGYTISSSMNEFKILEKVCKLVPDAYIPKSISSLKTKKIRFNKKCEADIKNIKNLIISQIISHS